MTAPRAGSQRIRLGQWYLWVQLPTKLHRNCHMEQAVGRRKQKPGPSPQTACILDRYHNEHSRNLPLRGQPTSPDEHGGTSLEVQACPPGHTLGKGTDRKFNILVSIV